MWQDYALMVGGFGFAIALLPTVFGKQKPDWKTSLSTGLILSLFVGVYASLGLWKTVVANGLMAALWFVLLIQRIKLKKEGS